MSSDPTGPDWAVTHRRYRMRRLLAKIGTVLSVGVIGVSATAAVNLAALESPPAQLPPVVAAVAASATLDTGGTLPSAEPDTHSIPSVPAAAAVTPIVRVDPVWAEKTSAATSIPVRALIAYAFADLTVDAAQPACGIGWNTIAAIGAIESDHGSHGGAVLGDDGYPAPAIRGIPLDGNGTAVIRDTDGGSWDGDTVWDRAVGPMQFIPDTWARWGADGNGDGTADPNQIDDAALATARYLCHGGDMTTTETWRAAVFSYNHLDSYVNDVAAVANQYATSAR